MGIVWKLTERSFVWAVNAVLLGVRPSLVHAGYNGHFQPLLHVFYWQVYGNALIFIDPSIYVRCFPRQPL